MSTSHAGLRAAVGSRDRQSACSRTPVELPRVLWGTRGEGVSEFLCVRRYAICPRRRAPGVGGDVSRRELLSFVANSTLERHFRAARAPTRSRWSVRISSAQCSRSSTQEIARAVPEVACVLEIGRARRVPAVLRQFRPGGRSISACPGLPHPADAPNKPPAFRPRPLLALRTTAGLQGRFARRHQC